MRKTIRDSLPDASPARAAYLHDRLDRVFGDLPTLSSVELTLAREDDDEDRHVVELRLEAHGGGPPIVVQSRRKRLPDALAQAFDGAEQRLRYGVAAGQPAA